MSFCPNCQQELPQDAFYLRKDTGKYRSVCIKCKGQQDTARRDPEARKVYRQEYYLANKPHINKQNAINQKKKNMTPEQLAESRRRLSERRKGKRPEHLIGFKHSEETKKIMSEKMADYYKTHDAPVKGKPHSIERRLRASEVRKGKNTGVAHWNWKGGESLEDRHYRKIAMTTMEYKLWRGSVFVRDGRKCLICGSTESIKAHHVTPWAASVEKRYDVDNGATLCDRCHRWVHRKNGPLGKKREIKKCS